MRWTLSPPAAEMSSALEVNGLTVAFRSGSRLRYAVRRLNFELKRGETLGIVGESGSGKSVACLSLLGLLPLQARILAGTADYDGIDLLNCPPRTLRSYRGKRIAMIFQDPHSALNPCMTIFNQLTEHLPGKRFMRFGRQQLRHTAAAALSEAGIDQPVDALDRYPHQFSGGQRQRILIAMALIANPDLLIADEPTTALDLTVQAQILQLLARLKRQRGLSMIFVSHDLSVIGQVADRVLVMQNGSAIDLVTTEQLFDYGYRDQLHSCTRQLLNALPVPRDKDIPDSRLVIKARGLSASYRNSGGRFVALRNASLQLRAGEIVGLAGESGSGKTTLARVLMGLTAADTGTVEYEGQDLSRLSPRHRRPLRRHVQMVFQNPYASLDPRFRIFNTIAEPLQFCNPRISRPELSSKVEQLLTEVELSAAMSQRYPHQFSGGQRQRIAIARALAPGPSVLIADEPVSALDVTIQQQIVELLVRLTEQRQLALLFISHDMRLLRSLCHRLIVMQAGNIIETGVCREIFEKPRHSFTKLLISAIPKHYGKQSRQA